MRILLFKISLHRCEEDINSVVLFAVIKLFFKCTFGALTSRFVGINIKELC